MIQNILIPGRHHLLTVFQHDYLQKILADGSALDLNGRMIEIRKNPNLIWAVTSANHSNTRRNPLLGNRREQMIEIFCNDLAAHSFSFPINDLGQTDRFAGFVVKEIEVQSRGQLSINPDNTSVICSTPAVIEMYQKLGYRILPAELAGLNPEAYSHRRPWDIVLAIVKAGSGWRNDPTFINDVHPAAKRMFEKYKLGDLIVQIFNDPLLSDEGDITDTRDYDSYRRAFEAGIDRKYELVRPFLHTGRIVDIGCATGEIIKFMSENESLLESDFYGIEASRKLYSICEQRRQNAEFGNENVFFYHRNIMTEPIFPPNSVDTTTTFSLTHEIESYLGREALLEFLRRVYQQTVSGGVYINSDVVGPDNKEQTVYLKLNSEDGRTESWDEISARPKIEKEELEKLSTFGRFRRFSKDFRVDEQEPFEFKEALELGPNFVSLKLADACEFLSKKDYLESWYSEMHERFCFWNFADWRKALENVGFKINEASRPYQNPWIINNRYKGMAELLVMEDGNLKPLEFPPTNVLLIAEKTY